MLPLLVLLLQSVALAPGLTRREQDLSRQRDLEACADLVEFRGNGSLRESSLSLRAADYNLHVSTSLTVVYFVSRLREENGVRGKKREQATFPLKTDGAPMATDGLHSLVSSEL